MKSRSWKQFLIFFSLIAIAAFALAGCSGSDGKDGINGVDGKPGTDGRDGRDATLTVQADKLTPEQWAALSLKGEVVSVLTTLPTKVTFKVTDDKGTPVTGLGSTSKSSTATVASYPNFGFALAKMVPGTNGSPSKWVSYIVTTVPTTTATTVAGARPTTDNTGTLVDNKDGSYTYTFYRDVSKVKGVIDALTDSGNNRKADLGDLTYQPNATHRLTIQIGGNAPGTGTNTPDAVQVTPGVAIGYPANIIFDFIPATGKAVTASDPNRIITSKEYCMSCHVRFTFHGGNRQDPKYCVVCHTDQRKFGQAEATKTADGYSGTTYMISGKAVGDFPTMVHAIHMGSGLTKTGYNYANVLFNHIGYPQGQNNCRKCHKADTAAQQALTPQGGNWSKVANRVACGACHDRVNWATGQNHIGGSKSDDSTCVLCHEQSDVEAKHASENATENNPKVPAGASNFTYQIDTVTVNANRQAVVKFRILKDGTPVTGFVGGANPLAGFTGGPSFLVAYATSQDGIASPADYNNRGRSAAQPASVSIGNIFNGTQGSVTGPDASGYYTATIDGASGAARFPAGAVMRSVALQGYFTQVNPAVARHTISAVKSVTGDTVRRQVVNAAKCGSCHEWFEGHGGNRVIGKETSGELVCLLCHNPNLSTSGRGANPANMTAAERAKAVADGYNPDNPLAFPEDSNNMKDMIHGIHAAELRSATADQYRFVRDRGTSGVYYYNWSHVTFPTTTKNCQVCHNASTATVGYNVIPTNALWTTTRTTGVANGQDPTAAAVTAARTSMPNNTDFVTSPWTAACSSCHVRSGAKAHYLSNGGQINVPRTSATNNTEQCALCHGAGRIADAAVVHK